MNRRLLPLLAAVALTAGCAAAGGVPETSDTPRRDLAGTPASLAPTAGGDTTDRPRGRGSASTAPGSATTATEPATAPSAGGSSSGVGSTATPTVAFRMFATLTDSRSDAGLRTPAYADLRLVTLAANDRDLRVTVVVDGELPQLVGADETMGIGVDLYPSRAQRESDFQLFVDGQPEGWYAYLDTPRGFVRYPGTFALGGSRLVFIVPLTTVRSPVVGRFSAFVDWSRRSSGLTGNASSNDYAPTLGTKRFTRPT